MRKLLILIPTAILLLIIGCRNNTCYTMLETVDSLTEKILTDSACKTIKELEDTYIIKDGKERAYYSLLKYQLQFRNKDTDINDSLIDYSISYYSDNMDERKLALSYYLKARMSTNKEAIKLLKKAEFIAEKTDDNFLKARIQYKLSNLNVANEDYKTALKYNIKAINYMNGINGDEALVWFTLGLSNIYGNLGYKDSCLFYVNKTLTYLKEASTYQKAYIYVNVAAAIETTDTAKARLYANKSIEYLPTNNAYQILAKIAEQGKDYESSEEYLNEALKYCESTDWEIHVLYKQAKIKDLMGKHKEASMLSQRVVKLNDSLEDVRAQDSIKEIQIAANKEHESQIEIKKQENNTIIIVLALAVIIVAVGTAYVIKRNTYAKSIDRIKAQTEKAKQDMEKQVEKHTMEIKTIMEKSKEKDKEIRNFDAKLKRTEENQKIKAVKMRQEEDERRHKGMQIYDRIKNGIKVANWTKEEMECLIAYYTIVAPEFMKGVSNRQGQFSEYQLIQMIMKEIGLTNKQIAEQLGTTENAVRAMASRIKKRNDMKE